MKTIHLICGRYYDFERKQPTIGGIQTYITNLLNLFKSLNFKCIVYQTYNTENTTEIDGVTIIQSAVKQNKKDISKIKKSFKKCMSIYKDETDILLFTTDSRIIKNKVKRSIAIQHGICWDIPRHESFSGFLNSCYTFNRSRHTFKTLERIRRVKNLVCVDYNFPNWYRAVSAYEYVPLHVIPNFSNIPSINNKPTDCINIIFARRLEKYRGTRLFGEAAKLILEKYPFVHVTIAGNGPEKENMKEVLSGHSARVSFIEYNSTDSLKIHSNMHIAVIPTVGSEGTSLSLLEAMSSQCAVICSNVGGMTNVVIDGFNGLIIEPNKNDLFDAMSFLIEQKLFRETISANAYETIKQGFSLKKWQMSWKKLIESLYNQ